MKTSEEKELERMTGVDPYEDEVEDGVPMWLYTLMFWVLLCIAWLRR